MIKQEKEAFSCTHKKTMLIKIIDDHIDRKW